MASIDFNTIIKHLKRQGWAVEATTRGHHRAAPPDRQKPLIHFSLSGEPRAIHNTLAQLKASGFQWPPVVGAGLERALDTDDDWVEAHNARVATAELEQAMTLEQARLAAAPPPETEEERVNRIFQELKDAKLTASLCREQLAAAAAVLSDAQAAYICAETEVRDSVAALAEKKQSFDAIFKDEEEPRKSA